MGKKQIAAAMAWERVLEKSVSGCARYLARARAVNILQVSTGCRFIKPSGIQLLEPFTFLPKTNVASMSKMPKAYKRLGVAVKNLLSVSKMKVARIAPDSYTHLDVYKRQR